MASYHDTLRYLYGLQRRGMKYGLRNTRVLVRSAGHPERAFPSLHIAGTNGKGSTASFLASILTASGYRVGLYTSPHLIRFTERVRIGGREIPEDRLVEYVRRLRPAIEATHATFFEATTCMAFCYFADEEVDIAVLETGLGGRLDATNVVMPLVSVITTIGYDHQEYLGTTLRSIAREKGGIIKPGVPVVTTVQDREALGVLQALARRRGVPLKEASALVRAQQTGTRAGRVRVDMRTAHFKVGTVTLGHPGPHQLANAMLAVAALEVLRGDPVAANTVQRITSSSIRRGLSGVMRNTGLRGRFEEVKTSRGRVVLDVAHNPDGMRVLAGALKARRWKCSAAVLGVMKDKDYVGMLRELLGVMPQIVAVRPHTKRALRATVLARSARQLGFVSRSEGSVKAGLVRALRELGRNRPQGPENMVLVTGSHYTVGEALAVLEENA